MNAADLMASVNTALDDPSWDSSVRSVKSVLRQAIQDMDSRVKIEDTTYFNHTFVPDFVLTWPTDRTQPPRCLPAPRQ